MRLSSLTACVLLLACASDAHTATYELPAEGTDVVGEITTVVARYEDTLVDLARTHGVGYQDIVRANPDVDVWIPGEGTEVVLPTRYILPPGPREGIVLNLAEYRLYYYPEPEAGETPVVMTYPISIGRQDWETPLGQTRVTAMAVNPTWYPPQSVRDEHAAEGRPLARVVPPGPDNPLGSRAMRLGIPGYLIHGTNRPAGVGMRVTHGCVRMFPEDIEYLFDLIAIDTKVRIINVPVKIGWQEDELLIEVHPVLASGPTTDEPLPPGEDDSAEAEGAEETVDAEADQHDAAIVTQVDAGSSLAEEEVVVVEDPASAESEILERDPLTYVTEQFIAATAERPGQLDWTLVEDVVERADGMPVTAGEAIKNAATGAAFE